MKNFSLWYKIYIFSKIPNSFRDIFLFTIKKKQGIKSTSGQSRSSKIPVWNLTKGCRPE
jgi:hypothetical protein